MRYRRAAAMILATMLGLIGATSIWTAICFRWYIALLYPRSDAPDQQSVPIPIVGFIAMYYLLPFGVVPAIAILLALGALFLLLAYIVVRRSR
jgi:hypothetical protein